MYNILRHLLEAHFLTIKSNKTRVMPLNRPLWKVNASRNHFRIVTHLTLPPFGWLSIKFICICLINRSCIVYDNADCNYDRVTLQLRPPMAIDRFRKSRIVATNTQSIVFRHEISVTLAYFIEVSLEYSKQHLLTLRSCHHLTLISTTLILIIIL